MYFIANWKMFGGLNTLNSLHKVINFLKKFKKSKVLKIVYCPPSTLIRPMSKKLKNTVTIGINTPKETNNEDINQIFELLNIGGLYYKISLFI